MAHTPLKFKVTPNFLNVQIQPVKARSRVYEMGTVIMQDVYMDNERVLTGEIIHEATEMDEPTERIMGQLIKVDPKNVRSGKYKAAYIVGDDVYVSKR